MDANVFQTKRPSKGQNARTKLVGVLLVLLLVLIAALVAQTLWAAATAIPIAPL